MSRLCILGSTGSIGKNVLKTVDTFKNKLDVDSLAVYSNIALLKEQIKVYKPKAVAVVDAQAADQLKKMLPEQRIYVGMEGISQLIQRQEVDTVVSAISGTMGIQPTYEAVQNRKRVCVANKESLVSAGHIIIPLARKLGIDFIPIDSEHTAIYHCLLGESKSKVKRIYLTASGGPFREYTANMLDDISVEAALNHPTWSMGGKNTIDSSTLVNKGLELIEAYYLYDLSIDQVEVIVHPQSIIHSMVEYIDGSIKAQLSTCDMRLPIQYALSYPDHWDQQIETLNFFDLEQLTFKKPNHQLFKGISLAQQAFKKGPSALACMNAANEVFVNRFLSGEIKWKDITYFLENIIQDHVSVSANTIDEVLEIDRDTRVIAEHYGNINKNLPVS